MAVNTTMSDWRKKLLTVAILLSPLFVASCNILAPGTERDRAELERHWRIWQVNGGANYSYVQRRLCFCATESTVAVRISVRNGEVTDRRKVEDNFPIAIQFETLFGTVEDLFRTIEAAINNDAAALHVTYDHRVGYPTYISIDYHAGVADDELTITSSGLNIID